MPRVEYRPVPAAGVRKKLPSLATMERWLDKGIAKTECGCTVEPDGTCPHGKPSLLIVAGII